MLDHQTCIFRIVKYLLCLKIPEGYIIKNHQLENKYTVSVFMMSQIRKLEFHEKNVSIHLILTWKQA